MSAHPIGNITYRMWRWAVDCCYDPTHKDYRFYGGQGISVHDRWAVSFEAYAHGIIAEIGARPEDLQIGRIDKKRGFVPGNVEWVSSKENNNNRRDNKLITVKGETKTAAEWADEVGLPRQQIANRINRGWDKEKALTEPLSERGHLIEIDGETLSITEWSERTRRPHSTILNRLKAGASAKDAVFGELSRKFDGICPRCRERPRSERDNYCLPCRRAYMADRAAKKKAQTQGAS